MAQRMPLELYDMWSGYQTCCWRSLPLVETKTPGVTWRLELIVQILFPLGIFHLTVNLKNWMEFFQIPPLKIYALERTG